MHKEGVFAYFPGATVARYKTLRRLFFSLDNAWQASYQELQQTGWSKELILSFIQWRENVSDIHISNNLSDAGIRCISIQDNTYPPLLTQLYDPPFCIFVRGDIAYENMGVAIVGPRKCSSYGKELVKAIVPTLVRNNITIVSGLAFGIDALAHKETLLAGGKTIAVLPGGVDNASIAPQAHVQLGNDIIHSGALISEFPPGTEIAPHSFPKRNRIVAGMATLTLVIEAAEKSGALITARLAMDLGRDVCAIPQDITKETGKGSNRLLQQGAHLIQSADDVLSLLNMSSQTQFTQARRSLPLQDEESLILQLFPDHPWHADTIAEQLNKPAAAVNVTLSLLEMKGYIRPTGGGYYQKTLI